MTIREELDILRGGRLHFLARQADAHRLCQEMGWNWKLARVYSQEHHLRSLQSCKILYFTHTGCMGIPWQMAENMRIHRNVTFVQIDLDEIKGVSRNKGAALKVSAEDPTP